jgi:hypothetical protein
MIGVMYRTPLRPEGLENRRGYQALDESHLPDDTEDLMEENSPAQNSEVIENTEWKTLSWSFATSAFVTVGPLHGTLCQQMLTLLSAPRLFFPCRIRDPDLRALPCRGMVMVVYTKPVICRPRCCRPFVLGSVTKHARRDHHGFSYNTFHEPGRCQLALPAGSLLPFQGMFVGWAILSPISKHAGWAPGPVGDQTDGARGWILWVALAIMSADSLISVIPVAAEFVEHISSFKNWTGPLAGQIDSNGGEVEPPMRLIPKTWVVAGVIASVCSGTLVIWLVFGNEGIRWWATILGFGLGGVLSLLGYAPSSDNP